MDSDIGEPGGEALGLDLQGIAIDRDADVPIGVQLAWALRSRIAEGALKGGQRLPGLRDLAEGLAVNVNTVRAVYQRLEGEGLIDSQQGVGTFVASTPPSRSPVETIAADAAREAEANGVDPRAVAAALYVAPETAPPPSGPEDDAVARRRALRAQIATLERAIAAMEAEHPGVAPAAGDTRVTDGPALLSARDLERVRAQLVHRLATVQSAIDAIGSEPAGPATPGAVRPGPAERAPETAKRPARARATNRPAGAET